MTVQRGTQHRLTARLLARRVPAHLAAQRRRETLKAAKREGETVSEARLVLLGWEVFVTNLPQHLASADVVFILTRVRWQIELFFKLWKSEGYLDESRSDNPWRILCEFDAQLLMVLLEHWRLIISLWQVPNRSLTKAAHTLRRFALPVATCFSSCAALSRLLTTISRSLVHGCRINKTKKSPLPGSFCLVRA